MDASELKQHQEIARAKIKSLYGTPEGENGPTLYVSHHLEEIEAEYWIKEFSVEKPDPRQILDALVFDHSWSYNDDGIDDVFDFTLPNNITNYVLGVYFVNGEVASVEMES